MELPKELAGTSVAILLFLNSVICNVGTWFIGKMDSGLATVRKPFFAVVSNSLPTVTVGNRNWLPLSRFGLVCGGDQVGLGVYTLPPEGGIRQQDRAS